MEPRASVQSYPKFEILSKALQVVAAGIFRCSVEERFYPLRVYYSNELYANGTIPEVKWVKLYKWKKTFFQKRNFILFDLRSHS